MVNIGLEEMVNKYLIVTAQYNAPVNKQLLASVDTYCKDNNAELLVLPTTGKNITEDPVLAPELQERTIISKDYNINKNLRIKDFSVRAQQINPLTGLERFAQGDRSYIIPGTKQVLKYVPNSNDGIPKALMTTGAITHPNYNLKHRVGRIAQQDHNYGFVVVENDKHNYFHFRHVRAMKNGKFVDLGILYNGKLKPKKVKTLAFVPGDLHSYDLNKAHLAATMEQIQYFVPENLFLHDTFDGTSISHHYKGKAKDAYDAYLLQGMNLQRELKDTLKVIKKFSDFGSNTYIVASNHDEHLTRYLDEGRFVGDKGNELIGAQLYVSLLQGKNPLREGLEFSGGVPSNVTFLERDKDFKILGVQLSNHGDLGSNGGRGSPRSVEIANGKSITGHSHTAFIMRDTYKVGTSTNMRVGYNRGYSNWSNTNAVLYADGSIQLLNTVNKCWRK